MVMITTEVQLDVDMEDITSDDLIDEIESRGYKVIQDEVELEVDKVYSLYRDYINDNGFDQKLKQFFEDQLGILVA